jgi:hypothetical protein
MLQLKKNKEEGEQEKRKETGYLRIIGAGVLRMQKTGCSTIRAGTRGKISLSGSI